MMYILRLAQKITCMHCPDSDVAYARPALLCLRSMNVINFYVTSYMEQIRQVILNWEYGGYIWKTGFET